MNNKKIIIIVSAIILIIVGLLVLFFNVKAEIKEDVSLYFTNENGEKVNASDGVRSTKTVGNYLIENSQITRTNGISTLTAKVINNGKDEKNVRFKVTFYDGNNTILATTTVVAGNIKNGDSTFIDAGISTDVIDAVNLTYEIK